MSAEDSNVSPTLSKRLFLTYLFSLCPLNNPILGSKSRGPSWETQFVHRTSFRDHRRSLFGPFYSPSYCHFRSIIIHRATAVCLDICQGAEAQGREGTLLILMNLRV